VVDEKDEEEDDFACLPLELLLLLLQIYTLIRVKGEKEKNNLRN
jgi:hypothetical protein